LRPPLAIPLAIAASCLLAAAKDPGAAVIPTVLTMVVWGVFVALDPPRSGTPRDVAVTALLVRLPLLACAPTLSDDVWRYVWEGRVWLAGFSPFVHAPDATVLVPLRDAHWALVNHREVSSIYPPLAQAMFVVLAWAGAWGFRIVATLADVGTAFLLARRDVRAGWLWALLPLPAVESAVSGHLEGVGILLMVLALGGSAWAAWAGGMVKLLPAVLLVHAARGRTLLLLAVASVIVTAPLLGAGLFHGFDTYRATWAFNGSVYVLWGEPSRPFLQFLGAGTVAGILWRSRDPGRIALWTCGAFVILSPTVHPWYVLWPLAAALWNGMRAWTVLAVLAPLSYWALDGYDGGRGAWTEPAWVRWVEYPIFFAALLMESARRLSRAGPAPVH